ncbi:MFS transporter [Acinetobacter baumannii]
MKEMRKQVLILAGSQAIFQTVTILLMTIGGLAGLYLAPNPAWSTIPLAMGSLGTAMVMFPASIMMSRKGRKSGFILGAIFGIISAAIAVIAMILHSFWLLCLAMFLLGVYQAFAQFYRFAAGEVATDAFRSHAISFVIAGGVVAAFAGPFLARLGSNFFTVPYVGSFILMGLASSLGVILLLKLRIAPKPYKENLKTSNARSWKKVIAQPAYLVALFSAASAYGIMVFAMTATPISMKHYGFSLSESASIIQLHVLGMYLPSFFTGRLVSRFGSIRIMLMGVYLVSICFI